MPYSLDGSSAENSPSGRTEKRPRHDRLGDMGRSAIFFGLLYLYLWLAVKPCLIYGCGTITNFPIFYKGWAFFYDSMPYPGGLLKYLSALLSQLFYYSWAGAIVITVQAWAICACTGWLFRMLGVPWARWLRFVPAFLVLAVYGQYTYHLPLITGALAAVFAACLYVRFATGGAISDFGFRISDSSRGDNPQSTTRNPQLISLAVSVVLSVVVYAASAAAFLPFAALCAAYELLYRRRYATGVAFLLLGAVVPYVEGMLVYHVSIIDAYTDLLPLAWRIRNWPTREKMIAFVYVLYLFPIVAVLVYGLWRAIAGMWSRRKAGAEALQTTSTRVRIKKAKPAKVRFSVLRRWLGASAVRWTVGSVVLLAVGGAVAVIALDREEQARLEVHYYACQRMWPEVLQAARRCPLDYSVMSAVNRALWHTGRLTRDMFAYPQHPDGLLSTGEDHILVYWNKFDTQIDLGLMNSAEKNLTECMEAFGEQPMILQRLAMVNMVKGSMDSAGIYLGALTKTLFYSRWARDCLDHLETDPNLSGDREIQDLRSRCLKKGDRVPFYAKEESLAALAAQDNHNRMAFEYLMAWYMQTKQLDKFVQNFRRLKDFGYTSIPPLYQEALLIYAYGTNKRVDLAGYTISPEARRRIEHFSDVLSRYNRNKDAAFQELARDYYNSYFLYHMYATFQIQR
jgi:hypothetical protein